MAGKKTQAEIEFKVIDDGLKKEFNNIKSEGTKLRQELKLEQEQMKQNGSDTDKLGANLNSLKAQYETQTRAVQTLEQQLSNAQKYFGENSNEANKYEKQLRSAQIYQQQLSNRIKETSEALSAAKGDTSSYNGAMNSIEQAQKKLSAEQAASTAEFKKWQATAGQTATDAQKLAKAQDYVGEQSKLAAAQVDLLKQALARTEQEFGSTSTEAIQMKTKLADAETAMAELGNEAKQVDTTNLDDIGKKIDTGNLMEAADAIGELGEKVKDIGGEAINMSSEMSDASFKVANGAQTMGLSMDDAKQHIRDISETGIGNFEDVGEAVSIVTNQMGDLDEKDLNSVTQSAMNLNKIFDSDMDETMRGANSLMQTYGMDGKAAMDLITAGTEQGLDKSHELGDNLAEYAPLMKQNGISAQDYFGMLKNGLESGAYNADKVNDVIKEMGIRINDGTARKGLESMGDDWVSMYDKAKKGGKSNAEIMELIQKKIGTLPNETKKAEAESTIWGTLAEDNGNKVMQSLFKTSGAFDKTAGSADKLNKKAQDNNQWQASLQKMKDALLPIGDTIKDTLQPLLDMVAKIAKAFEGLPEPAKKFIVVIGGIMTALTILAPIAAAVGTAIGIIFSPITLIIAAIGLAIAGVILAIKNWGAIVDWLKGVWEPIAEFFSGLWDGIKQGASGIWDSVKETWQSAVDGLKNIWSSIADFFSGLWQGIVDTASTIWNTLVAVFQVVFMTIQSVIQGVWLFIASWLQFAWNAIVQLTEPIWRPIADFFTNLWNGISNVAQSVWTTLSGWLSTAWNAIKNTVSTVFNAVSGVISGVWNAVSGVTQTVWNAIKSAVTTVANAVGSVVSNVWNGIKNVTSNVWNAIKNVISGVWDGIKNVASSAANGISNTISNVWNGIKNTTANVWNGIKSAMTGPVEAAKNIIGGIVDRVKSLFNIHLSFPSVSIPHIPMPVFNVSGKFGLNPPQVPHLNVRWNALGGIFNKPTLFGGASGLQGVGEAGPEAVLPLNNSVLGTIGNAIAAATDSRRFETNSATYNIVFNNEIASDYDVNSMFEKTDQWLANKGARNNFGVRGNV
ncbi:phage tail tape measure protein [Latilactobacillus curvatus]|uniref:phage tail tape measure protein n=1 Tax=Latilactobacillus curvatus TaxID=28038 RepID=UPI0039AF550C